MHSTTRLVPVRPAVARAILLVLLAVGFGVSPARAMTITGTIVNGTTGAKNMDADVVVIAPAKGMKPVASVHATNGTFSIPDLGTDVPVYLVQVNYGGISYRESVQPSEAGDTADVMILVYESTTEGDAIRLNSYHIAALRHENVLTIEQLFSVNNVGSPGRTITGDGAFRFLAPAGATIRECYVMGQGMPIKRSPVATDRPDEWRIDYPIRPGITQVDVTFDVPYDSSTYTMPGKTLYEVDEFSVFQADPHMTVTSDPPLEVAGDMHGMKQYGASKLQAGSSFSLTFAGGNSESAMPAGHGDIITVHNEMQNASVVVIVLVLLAMMAFMAMSLHGHDNPLDRSQNLRAYYDGLLRRLARLDDLHEAQAIDRDAYRARRDDIKRQLAAIVYRLREAEKTDGSTRKSGASAVGGKERARA